MWVFCRITKTNGDDYEPDSLRVMFIAIDKHLKSKSYPKSIREDNIFSPLAAKFWKKRPESYVLKVKGKDHTRAQSLNAEEEKILWTCGQL